MPSLLHFTVILGLCATFSCSLKGQDPITWNEVFPYESACPSCTFKELFVSFEDQIIVLVTKYTEIDTPYHVVAYPSLYSYSHEGNLLWSREYRINAELPAVVQNKIGAEPQSILQLSDSTLLITGQYFNKGVEGGFFLRLSALGDSLKFLTIDSIKLVGTTHESQNSLLFVGITDSAKHIYCTRSSLDSGVMQLDEIEKSSNLYWQTDTTYIVHTIETGIHHLMMFSIGEHLQTMRSLSSPQRYLIVDREHEGMISIERDSFRLVDDSLRDIWSAKNELFDWGFDGEDILDAIWKPDGSFVIAGTTYSANLQFSFLIKIDKNGEKEWGWAYSQDYLPLNEITEITSIEDEYVIVGGIYENAQLWIVRLSAEGLLSAKSNLDNSKNNEFYVFPNPSIGFFYLKKIEKFEGTATLFSINGIELLKKRLRRGLEIEEFNILIDQSCYLTIQDQKGNLVATLKCLINKF